MRRLICAAAIALSIMVVAGSAFAAVPATAQREITGLMNALQGSQCRFQRNGTWYGETDARAHLQRKYDYLAKRNRVNSAEQFIELAASGSSMSGKPYRITCPGAPEQDAARWFGERLHELRQPAR